MSAIAFTRLNTVTFAPIPSAREASATIVNSFAFAKLRIANRMSLIRASIVPPRQAMGWGPSEGPR